MNNIIETIRNIPAALAMLPWLAATACGARIAEKRLSAGRVSQAKRLTAQTGNHSNTRCSRQFINH
jgi:hypothetical protein